MAIKTQIRLAQLTGSIDDGQAANDAATGHGTVAADSLQGVLNAVGESIQKLNGFAAFNIGGVGEFAHTIKPNGTTHDLGSAAAEWQDLYLQDELFFGTAQNVKLKQNANGLILSGGVGAPNAALFFKDLNSFISVGGPSNEVMEIQQPGQITIDTPVVELEDDGVVLALGANRGVELTHIAADDALRLIADGGSGVPKLEFGANTEFIGETSPGVVEVEAGTKILLDSADVEIDDGLVSTPNGTALSLIPGTANDDTIVGSSGGTGALKVMYDDIEGSNGQSHIQFKGTNEVVIPGSLTVLGAQTVIDTTNLIVEDRKIGLNYTSGSKAGGAAQVGFVFGQDADADTPALVWNNAGTGKFRLYLDDVGSTSGSFDGTSLGDNTKALRLELGEVALVNSRKIFGDGTNEAIELTTGADPDVKVRRQIQQLDTRKHVFGADQTMKKYGIAAQTAQNVLEFSGSFGAAYNFKLGASVGGPQNTILSIGNLGLQVMGTSEALITANAAANQHLKVSGSAGERLKLHGSDLLKLTDKHRDLSSWSDVDGISLAAAPADWTNFDTAFGEVSLLAAITAARGGAASIGKKTLEITGSGFPTTPTTPVPLGANVTDIPEDDHIERIDVFVNGQLLLSGSPDGSAPKDYFIVGPIADLSASFRFPLVADDVVSMVVR